MRMLARSVLLLATALLPVSAQAQANRQLLLAIMEGAGFVHIAHEWWHYALPEPSRYPLLSSEALGPLNPMHSAP